MEPRLTQRQYEILFLIAHGYRHREIADRLHLSTQTIKNHMAVIVRRLDARSASHAVYLVFGDPDAIKPPADVEYR